MSHQFLHRDQIDSTQDKPSGERVPKDDFGLLVGDVLLADGKTVVFQAVSVKRSDEVVRVYHNLLAQNYPNPFNPQTTISYSIAKDRDVELAMYNVSGQRVWTLVNEDKRQNAYEVVWNDRDDRGNPVASGVYFYKLIAGDFTASKKMLLLQ